MILFFDTETTGLPRNYKAPCTDLDNWPRTTQLAFEARHDNGEIFYSKSYLIKPNGWTIPTRAELIASGNKDPDFFERNNMSTERCNREGTDIYFVLHEFAALLLKCKSLAAHNMDFDLPVIRAELIRAGIPLEFEFEQICTMKISTDVCQLPGPYGFKWPKLEELVAWLGGKTQGAHDAGNDVNACAYCYFELKKRGLLPMKQSGNIIYTNIIRHDNMPSHDYFKLPGYSHSFLKREQNGVVEAFPASAKMMIGSMVDAILTDPKSVDVASPYFAPAKDIAIILKQTFGDMISRFSPQVSYTGEMTYKGITMPTTGRLDWQLGKHAVIDLKVTSATSLPALIRYMGYDNQLWNYAHMAGVKKAYILAYSSTRHEPLPITEIDISSDYNEFWAAAILKFGKVVQ